MRREGRAPDGRVVLATLASAAPAAFALWYILTYAVNGAPWDHLIVAELFERFHTGSLTLEYLTRPHLEHIKIFPRLVALGLGLMTSFDNVTEMVAQWALLCASAGILFVTLRRRLDVPASSVALLFPPVTLALFNLRQHQSMLTGDGMITYLSIASVTAALCVLDRAATPAGVAAAAAAGVVGSFSHAAATLVWPLGMVLLLVPDARRSAGRRTALAIWVACGAAVVALYTLRLPVEAGGAIRHAVTHPADTLSYIVAASGVPFAAAAGPQRAAGLVALALELGIVALAVRAGRASGRVPLGVWFVAFALGCRVLMAAGRLQGAADGAVPSRYAAFVSLAALGAYIAALEMRRTGIQGRLGFVLAAMLAVGSVAGYLEGLRAGPDERDTRLRIAQLLRTSELQNDATLERWVYPYAPHARAFAASLRARRLNVFAEPPIDLQALAVTSGVTYSFDWINGTHVPLGGTLEVSADQSVQIAGWAFEARGEALAAVYAQFGDQLVIPAAYGMHRPDVPAVLPGAPTAAGFVATISAAALGSGPVPLRLHFVTADRARVSTTPVLVTIVR